MLAEDRRPPTTDRLPAGSADPLSESVPSDRRAADGHLGAVDVVRLVTIVGVILVHCTSLTLSYGSVAAGAVLEVAHVTRSVFLMLSAFVLTYSVRRRPLGPVAFWRRRYPLVVVPYATWSLIYVLTGGDLRSPAHVAALYLTDLYDGRAKFHLYFLLLTMQLYLVFPALVAAFRRHPRVLVPATGVALAAQLAFTTAVHYGSGPGLLGVWIRHQDTWLLSYVVYVLAGMAAAVHLDAVTGWVRAHSRAIYLTWVASVGAALAGYVADLTVLRYSPLKASEVFQPAVTVEAVTATAAQYALGLRLVDRLGDRARRWLERSSDVSFGVYLAHPLLIGAVLDVAMWCGLYGSMAGLPSGAGEALVAVGLVPFVYSVSRLGVAAARRSPASLALTGRRRPAPAGSTG